jgi:hypothetical protein
MCNTNGLLFKQLEPYKEKTCIFSSMNSHACRKDAKQVSDLGMQDYYITNEEYFSMLPYHEIWAKCRNSVGCTT